MSAADRLPAAALAACAAATGVPLALAQLDFSGVLDVFRIDSGDVAEGLLVLAAVGGSLTCCVVAVAFAAAALCLAGSRAARPLLLSSAVAGLATALLPWLPSALMLGAAAHLLERGTDNV